MVTRWLVVVVFLLSVTVLSAQEDENSSFVSDGIDTNISVEQDPLLEKIQSFLSPQSYEQNKEFIRVIFEPKSDFYREDRVDAVKVVQTLKENGLLHLFFQEPKVFELRFKTNGSPLFFVKIMGDALNALGYFRYVTKAATRNASEFTWSIAIRSEYATDPLILQKQLEKNSCSIVDIERISPTQWTYLIDMNGAYLDVPILEDAQVLELKRSLYAYWFDVSKIRALSIKSSTRNKWYPYIAYYDASLHLVKLTKQNRILKHIKVTMPKNAKYIRISDLYSLKNIKDGLELIPKGAR